MEYKTISVDQSDKVIIVKLHRSVTNALNLTCVKELTDIVQRSKMDRNIQGFVLGSTNEKFFSNGNT